MRDEEGTARPSSFSPARAECLRDYIRTVVTIIVCRPGAGSARPHHLFTVYGAECVRDYIRLENGKVVTRTFLVGPDLFFSVQLFGAECRRDYIHLLSERHGKTCRPLVLSLWRMLV